MIIPVGTIDKFAKHSDVAVETGNYYFGLIFFHVALGLCHHCI